MCEVMKVCVFLFCVFVKAQSENPDCINDRDGKTRQLVVELNKETSDNLKWRMDALFHNLVESIHQQLIMINSNIHYELEMLNNKIDTNHKELTKMNKLISRFSNVHLQNLKIMDPTEIADNLSYNGTNNTKITQLSDSFGIFSKSPNPNPNNTIDTINLPKFENQSESMGTTEQPKEFPTRVIVEELSENSGTIEFDGKANPNIRRKIWILQHDENSYISDARFVMEENKLGENAYLTIWSGSISPLNRHLYNGSQGDWRKERRSSGNLILVTLTIRNYQPADVHPQFKLRFNATRSESAYAAFSSEVMTKEGPQLLSFPPSNDRNYLPRSLFYAVIAPRSGTPFQLSLKYLDVPVIMPHCWGYLFRVYFIKESPTDTQYKAIPGSIVRHCQKPGNVSELIGHSTVAIVRFESFTSNRTGRGFVMEVEPSDGSD